MLLNQCMQHVIMEHESTAQHAVDQQTASCASINHKTCSTQGYRHNPTTAAQTAMRPNHYLAVVVKPCQGEAPNILLPSHILIICN